MTNTSSRRIWITWQEHRRSREIADWLGAHLIVMSSELPRPFKYVPLVARTIGVLALHRGDIVFCQNPSVVLAFVAVLLRRFVGIAVVVDRHSNFKLHTTDSRAIKWRVFHWLSRYSIRSADLTIVTNQYLADLVTMWGGTPFVMQDPIPSFNGTVRPERGAASSKPTVTCVCTYADDEPIDEMLGAIADSRMEFNVNITGRPSRRVVELVRDLGLVDRVNLTGFLPRPEYLCLLATSDVVMVLTTLDHCLTCGAYEATALGRPMVLSDTIAIRGHFSRGAVYAKPKSESIRLALEYALGDRERLGVEVSLLRNELERHWQERRLALEELLLALHRQ